MTHDGFHAWNGRAGISQREYAVMKSGNPAVIEDNELTGNFAHPSSDGIALFRFPVF